MTIPGRDCVVLIVRQVADPPHLTTAWTTFGNSSYMVGCEIYTVDLKVMMIFIKMKHAIARFARPLPKSEYELSY